MTVDFGGHLYPESVYPELLCTDHPSSGFN